MEKCRNDSVRLQLSEGHLTWPLANDNIKVPEVPDTSDTVDENAHIHTTQCVKQSLQRNGMVDTLKKEADDEEEEKAKARRGSFPGLLPDRQIRAADSPTADSPTADSLPGCLQLCEA